MEISKLVKKVLNIKQDYVKMINENLGEDILNEFLEKVNENRGKIIDIKNMLKIRGETEYIDNQYVPSGESKHDSINSEIEFLIHYRCYKKIEYDSPILKERNNKYEKEIIKYFKQKSKKAVKKLKEEENRMKNKPEEKPEGESEEIRGPPENDVF
jgi:hypothetical protein